MDVQVEINGYDKMPDDVAAQLDAQLAQEGIRTLTIRVSDEATEELTASLLPSLAAVAQRAQVLPQLVLDWSDAVCGSLSLHPSPQLGRLDTVRELELLPGRHGAIRLSLPMAGLQSVVLQDAPDTDEKLGWPSPEVTAPRSTRSTRGGAAAGVPFPALTRPELPEHVPLQLDRSAAPALNDVHKVAYW
ncbi:hypothetical protein ABPG75_001628 [Micractinium tetrahymenae]